MTTAILTEHGFERVAPFNPNELTPELTEKLLSIHRAAVRVGDIAAAHSDSPLKFTRWVDLLDRRDDLIHDILTLGGYTREAVRAVLPSVV